MPVRRIPDRLLEVIEGGVGLVLGLLLVAGALSSGVAWFLGALGALLVLLGVVALASAYWGAARKPTWLAPVRLLLNRLLSALIAGVALFLLGTLVMGALSS